MGNKGRLLRVREQKSANHIKDSLYNVSCKDDKIHRFLTPPPPQTGWVQSVSQDSSLFEK